MTGEGHKWSVAGEFRAPPGNGSSEGGGERCRLEAAGEPEGAFGNRERCGEQRGGAEKVDESTAGQKDLGSAGRAERVRPRGGQRSSCGVAEGI